MPRVIVLLALPIALALGACGDDGPAAPQPAPRAATTATVPPVPERLRPLLPPAGVPRAGTEDADPADVEVVERWAATLRTGDVRGAARFWAVPAVAQNLSPPLPLRTAADVLTFNRGLTCGAVVSTAKAADGFLVVDFVLTRRKGGDPGCAASAGAPARVALRIRDGRIAAWYRVAPGDDGDSAPPLAPTEAS